MAIPSGERRTICAQYRAGYTTHQIAERVGYSEPAIVRVLWAAGIQYRAPTRDASRLPKELRKEIVILYQEGRSLSEVVSAVRVPWSTVRRVLLLAHVQLRPRGGRATRCL
jgi:hypothetical protein